MYDPSKRHIELTSTEGKRFKSLGDIGELLAKQLLLENGFIDVVDLNGLKANFPFADFSATKNDVQYLISVKARNKYENNGKINSRYKLGSKSYEHIKVLLTTDEFKNHKPAWLAIALEEKTFDAYFGLIEQLNSSRGINMSAKAKSSYVELAKEKDHTHDFSDFGNVYKNKC